MWEMVVGFISATFVLPIVQQPTWSPKTRALVTFVYAVVVGLVTAYLTGAFADVHDVRAAVSAVLTVLISSIAFYHGFAKPTGVAPVIERATSPTDTP
jgi:biotin transporter BioY